MSEYESYEDWYDNGPGSESFKRSLTKSNRREGRNDMDISKMVLLCLETFQAGYDADQRLIQINWVSWDEERTPEIRCVFWFDNISSVCCRVYPSVSRTHGVDLHTRRTWELPDKVLLRDKIADVFPYGE
jgi:hypothetical protein